MGRGGCNSGQWCQGVEFQKSETFADIIYRGTLQHNNQLDWRPRVQADPEIGTVCYSVALILNVWVAVVNKVLLLLHYPVIYPPLLHVLRNWMGQTVFVNPDQISTVRRQIVYKRVFNILPAWKSWKFNESEWKLEGIPRWPSSNSPTLKSPSSSA